jgi:hypothetical protein
MRKAARRRCARVLRARTGRGAYFFLRAGFADFRAAGFASADFSLRASARLSPPFISFLKTLIPLAMFFIKSGIFECPNRIKISTIIKNISHAPNFIFCSFFAPVAL